MDSKTILLDKEQAKRIIFGALCDNQKPKGRGISVKDFIIVSTDIANRLEKFIVLPNGRFGVVLNGSETKIQKVDEKLIITTDGDLAIKPQASNRVYVEVE